MTRPVAFMSDLLPRVEAQSPSHGRAGTSRIGKIHLSVQLAVFVVSICSWALSHGQDLNEVGESHLLMQAFLSHCIGVTECKRPPRADSTPTQYGPASSRSKAAACLSTSELPLASDSYGMSNVWLMKLNITFVMLINVDWS
jgi:hypothetical protein